MAIILVASCMGIASLVDDYVYKAGGICSSVYDDQFISFVPPEIVSFNKTNLWVAENGRPPKSIDVIQYLPKSRETLFAAPLNATAGAIFRATAGAAPYPIAPSDIFQSVLKSRVPLPNFVVLPDGVETTCFNMLNKAKVSIGCHHTDHPVTDPPLLPGKRVGNTVHTISQIYNAIDPLVVENDVSGTGEEIWFRGKGTVGSAFLDKRDYSNATSTSSSSSNVFTSHRKTTKHKGIYYIYKYNVGNRQVSLQGLARCKPEDYKKGSQIKRFCDVPARHNDGLFEVTATLQEWGLANSDNLCGAVTLTAFLGSLFTATIITTLCCMRMVPEIILTLHYTIIAVVGMFLGTVLGEYRNHADETKEESEYPEALIDFYVHIWIFTTSLLLIVLGLLLRSFTRRSGPMTTHQDGRYTRRRWSIACIRVGILPAVSAAVAMTVKDPIQGIVPVLIYTLLSILLYRWTRDDVCVASWLSIVLSLSTSAGMIGAVLLGLTGLLLGLYGKLHNRPTHTLIGMCLWVMATAGFTMPSEDVYYGYMDMSVEFFLPTLLSSTFLIGPFLLVARYYNDPTALRFGIFSIVLTVLYIATLCCLGPLLDQRFYAILSYTGQLWAAIGLTQRVLTWPWVRRLEREPRTMAIPMETLNRNRELIQRWIQSQREQVQQQQMQEQ